MNILKITILSCITALSLVSCTRHSEDKKMKHNNEDILKIEQLRVDALLNNDIETLTKIMHPDAVHISSNGSRKTTSEWLEGRKNSTVPFETFTLNDDQTIRFYKNMAFVDGSYTNSRRIKDSVAPLKHARYTRVYKKVPKQPEPTRKGNRYKWQLITHQATEIQ
ncbi:nuclear transport factor 2 family protein [Maribacter ulvicola]|uniref:DUF4440 domain-containing protein n=1 Tax=Maribacter ulvicola TaxID=228959 RepID=A0A1N6QTB8_9FLAO|nr:nuclear transport factor 2 family protein [Maribacter ulvicola]SIQ19844.1 protein of unknown function [Maribacter ulvicola]